MLIRTSIVTFIPPKLVFYVKWFILPLPSILPSICPSVHQSIRSAVHSLYSPLCAIFLAFYFLSFISSTLITLLPFHIPSFHASSFHLPSFLPFILSFFHLIVTEYHSTVLGFFRILCTRSVDQRNILFDILSECQHE